MHSQIQGQKTSWSLNSNLSNSLRKPLKLTIIMLYKLDWIGHNQVDVSTRDKYGRVRQLRNEQIGILRSYGSSESRQGSTEVCGADQSQGFE